VLANGSLTTTSGGEGDIRRRLIEADLVEGIIAMPNQLFYNDSIPVSVWFFNRKKKNPGKVLFIDARNMGMMVDRTHRELSDDLCRYDSVKKEDKPWANVPAKECDVQRIAATFRAYEAGKLEDVKGFCAVKSINEIRQQDCALTPGRYVGIADEDEDAESFEQKMARYSDELGNLFAECHRLEHGIREQLKIIGFSIKEY
jgi:type I restriction enzyme M protein